MALFVGGTQVTSTQTLDATKLTGNLPAINGSSLTNLPSSTPSNSDILSGVASVSAGNVGSYVIFTGGSFGKNLNDTFSTNNAMYFCGPNHLPNSQTQPSGTYRSMSVSQSNNGTSKATGLFLRIS